MQATGTGVHANSMGQADIGSQRLLKGSDLRANAKNWRLQHLSLIHIFRRRSNVMVIRSTGDDRS